jgi:integrase
VVEGWLPRFPDAWRWKDLPEDPAAVRLLTVEELEFIAGANLWTPEQLALIKQPHTKVLRELDAASGRRFQDYVKLLAWSGGREQETCKQKWSNVDWEVGLKFPGQVAKRGAGRPSPDRWVHWNPRLEAHLRDMETRRDRTTDYMFPGEVDRQEVAGRKVAGHQGSFRKQWENACEKLEGWHISKGETPDRALELADIGFHVTRHFFIRLKIHRQLHIAGVFEFSVSARDLLLKWFFVTRLQHRIAKREVSHAFHRDCNSAVVKFEFRRPT